MDKEESSSRGKHKEKAGIPSAEGIQNSSGKNGITSKSNVKTRRRKKSGIKPQLWIAIIPAIATIVAALIDYRWDRLSQIPILIPTSAITVTTTSSLTPSITNTPVTLSSSTPTFAVSPSLTITDTLIPLPTETITPSPHPKLFILLTPNKNSGNVPLKVKLDARDTYLTDYDGEKYVCRNRPCNYIWKVYFYDAQVGKAKNDTAGTFDYTFGKRGTYTVTVWICQGRETINCGGTSTQITAK